ncbi:WG repeat-containing protein [Elizabethkingia miricola]|uniref:WG repeat-containing protein n=1 Tax=Elizabethkingia miricola TaxID=172045 RepID=UPI000B35D09E|nr:WG repeat-containing protein [Elizabethkingia miricola]NHQ67099.1 WG repeat-containing protein [Elizabethkingia miricola]NHQ70736.1 WG repeat-containing protein [Elizabethkingia miricola]NHQ77641.1 WG repeat-containing protein [Elizabethkingia miricola]PSL88163.1 WG repeat-containing protein [Elizabethkingia miricola]QHQ87629.1 WG repeat-containing protein [Elizabethkingia miricola]
MKIKSLLAFLIISIILGSCSSKGIEDIETKADYIQSRSGMSQSQLKEQLDKDAKFIKSVIDTANSVEFSGSFSMSAKVSGSGTGTVRDTAKAFGLGSPDSIRKDFNDIKEVNAIQSFRLPTSGFSFNPLKAMQKIDAYDIKYKINKIFEGNKEVTPESLKLKQPDSIAVTASYSFPVAYDTLVISKSNLKEATYKGTKIEIDKFDGQSAEISIPIEIGSKIIGQQGVTSDGVLVATSNYSSFPSTGISSQVLGEMQKMLNTLKKAGGEAGKEAMVKDLQELSEKAFTYKNKLQQLTKDIDEFAKADDKKLSFGKIMRIIEEFTKKYKDLIAPKISKIELGFPAEVDKIYFYVATKEEILSKDLMASALIKPEGNEVFFDEKSDRYGIIDKNSNIIIPATYEQLERKDNLYFTNRVDTIETSYFLDLKNKKLEKLPDNMSYKRTLNNDFSLFNNKEDYTGVLKNNKDEIIPFKYDDITMAGNVFIAKATKRGRPYYDFYSIKGKKLETPFTKEVSTTEGSPNIVIKGKDNKYGVIDENGKLTVEMKPNELRSIGQNMIAYRELPTKEMEYIDLEKLGIMTGDGKIISQPQYSYVGNFSSGLAPVAIYDSGNSPYFYINTKGQPVFNYKFDEAYPFYKGYALILSSGEYYLIDTKGNKVLTFPGGADYKADIISHPTAHYNINGQYYDYKGNPVKL